MSHLAEGTLKQQLRGENVTGATGTAATEQAHLFRDAPFQTYYIMATVEMNKYARQLKMHWRRLAVTCDWFAQRRLLSEEPQDQDELEDLVLCQGVHGQ